MKTLHYFIITIVLGVISLMLSHDNSVYGLWIRQPPQELLNGSSTIFVGNITSTNVLQFEKEFRYTMEVNGTDKNMVQNYTLNLDEYNVDVEEFLKNPQNTNKIIVRQPTISLPTGLGGLDKFKTGDRVLFYIKNLDGINEYSPESFIIPKSCDAKDVLTQKRLESRGESIIIQNGIKVDNNFTANKPILFIDNEDVDTLSGKSLDVQVYITKTVGNGAEVVFSKEIHAVAKPCEWTTSAKWEFTPQEGEYGMAVRMSEDNKTYSQYYGKFSVKSDVITPDHMSPLKQFKSGIAANDVKCKDGLHLIIKSEDGSPACVKPTTASKLVELGWAKVLTTENTTLNALENNCGQFYTVPQDNHPNGSETYPVLILKQNSIGCAKLTYTINYNYNDNRSGSVWSQMLNFTDMFHIGKYNYTTHENSFGISSIDTMQMFKIKSIPEVVDLAKYPVGSQFTVTLIIQPLQNATGFYDYSIEEIPCNSYPLAVGYSPDRVNSTDFSKGMIGMHNHSCFNMPYEISSVQVSGMDFKQIKFS